MQSWPSLETAIVQTVKARDAVVDGEICCFDPDGRSNFANLFFRREKPTSTRSICWRWTAKTCAACSVRVPRAWYVLPRREDPQTHNDGWNQDVHAIGVSPAILDEQAGVSADLKF